MVKTSWCQKILITYAVELLVAYVSECSFVLYNPRADICHIVMNSLNNVFICLIINPLFLIVLTYAKDDSLYRYVDLIRRKNVTEYAISRIMPRLVWPVLVVIEYAIASVMVSYYFIPANEILFSGELDGDLIDIIICQIINEIILMVAVHIFREVAGCLISSRKIAVLCTIAVIFLDFVATKLHWDAITAWTPWGHVRYLNGGQATPDYRVYLGYWMLIALILALLVQMLRYKRSFLSVTSKRFV